MVHVPVAIATSMASSVIPTLSKAMARRDRGAALDSINQIVRFTMLIAIPSAVGLAVLAEPIMMVLFSGNNQEAIKMMAWGSSAVVFFSLSTVTNGVLQGIGHMKQPIINAALSLVLHVVLLAAMLWGFKMGIYGVVVANIIFGASMCVLNAISIRKIMNFQQEIKKTFLLPLACSGVMGAAVWGLYKLIYIGSDSHLISMVISIVVGVFLYFVLLLLLKCVDEVELSRMPFGRTLASFGKKLHLL